MDNKPLLGIYIGHAIIYILEGMLGLMSQKNGFNKKNRNKKKIVIEQNEIILIILIASFVLGIVVGVIRGLTLDREHYMKLVDYLIVYQKKSNEINNFDIFFECVVKYGKIPIVLWFMAFLPYSIIFPPVLIFTKGMSLAFTTTSLVREFGLSGFNYVMTYIPQSIIIVPAYIFTAYSSIKFILMVIRGKKFESMKGSVVSKRQIKINPRDIFSVPMNLDKNFFINYLITFIISIFCTVAASLIEAFVIPFFLT